MQVRKAETERLREIPRCICTTGSDTLGQVNTESPTRLPVGAEDLAFLEDAARRILGTAQVAGTTADACRSRLIDSDRIGRLIPGYRTTFAIEGFVFKKVEPDAETPDNFGLFVRRH